jgi:lipopolysaccharide/colanic/teichoic acid biosynthesis glycosyltransferase
MIDARDIAGNMLPDGQRLTPFGRFLRKTSLDELPELLNVIKGEMSLVGPRPLLMRYYPYFTDEERVRFTVRPGITGLAQVSGRNDLSWDLRIAADIEYVRTYSFWMDITILFKTALTVFTHRGLQVDPGATMLDFDEERRCAANNVSEMR